MNKLLKQFVPLLILWFSVQTASSQCMLVPVPLNERLANAQLVVEGVVESERSVWDNNHQLIYTLYTIKPTTLFKGSV
ncbi:MAG: hypothetical protein JNM68_16955, partial [Dinghuibacter sp.]|nr:hypothetical protein [Dinghuibacter sp.]